MHPTIDELESPQAYSADLLARARLQVYSLLVAATSDPRTAAFDPVLDAGFCALSIAALDVIRWSPEARPAELARGEIDPRIGLRGEPMLDHLRVPREQIIEIYDRTFGLLLSSDCPPYETEYCPQTFSVSRSQRMADIAGFYRAFGLRPSPTRPRRHDHLVLELELMAWLIAKSLRAKESGRDDGIGVCLAAQQRFLRDHLAWWVPAFALALRRKADGVGGEDELGKAPTSWLGGLGRLIAAFVPAERAMLGVAPPAVIAVPHADEDEGACDGCPGADAACSLANGGT